jgi:acetylornithine deacetylase
MIDAGYTVSTLQKLVQINSVNPGLVPGAPGEKEIASYINSELQQMGLNPEISDAAPGRPNVICVLKGNGGGKSLMINAHTDTVGVEGMENPFGAQIVDGKLYGRGSYDMKSGIAAMLSVAKTFAGQTTKLSGDLVLTFVADEEHESVGASAVAEKIRTDAAIVTEPTDLRLCLAHRGFAIHKITVHGKTAHGGNHMLGIDANLKAASILTELASLAGSLPGTRKHPLCGEGSMHVPLIEGGRSLFIYSHKCTFHTERRTLPGETVDSVNTDLTELMNNAKAKDPDLRADIEEVLWRSPYEISPDREIVKTVTKAAESVLGRIPETIGHTWWEDSAIFGEAGMETMILGAKGGGIHEDVEWVNTSSVIDLAEILYRTALDYCS